MNATRTLAILTNTAAEWFGHQLAAGSVTSQWGPTAANGLRSMIRITARAKGQGTLVELTQYRDSPQYRRDETVFAARVAATLDEAAGWIDGRQEGWLEANSGAAPMAA